MRFNISIIAPDHMTAHKLVREIIDANTDKLLLTDCQLHRGTRDSWDGYVHIFDEKGCEPIKFAERVRQYDYRKTYLTLRSQQNCLIIWLERNMANEGIQAIHLKRGDMLYVGNGNYLEVDATVFAKGIVWVECKSFLYPLAIHNLTVQIRKA